MFSSLKSREVVADTNSSSQLLNDLFVESLQLDAELQVDVQDILTIRTTINELRALYVSVETYGLTPSLLHFANTNNQLSNVIPTIPSLESLSAEFTDVDRDAALEGIANTIKNTIQKILSKIKAMFDKIISRRKLRAQSIDELRKQLSHYTDMVKDKTFNTEVFQQLTAKLFKYDILIEFAEIATCGNSLLSDLMKLELPDTREAHEVFEKKFSDTIHEHVGKYSVVFKDKFITPKVIKAQFSTMGYSEQSFSAIGAKLEAYVHEELTNASRLETEFNRWFEDAYKRIDSMSVETWDKNGYHHYQSESAMILEHALYHICEYTTTLDNVSWSYGIHTGLNVMGYMTKAYTSQNSD